MFIIISFFVNAILSALLSVAVFICTAIICYAFGVTSYKEVASVALMGALPFFFCVIEAKNILLNIKRKQLQKLQEEIAKRKEAHDFVDTDDENSKASL